MTLCNDTLQVLLTGTSRLHSVRCNLESHGDQQWHRGVGNTRWKTTRGQDLCQVGVGEGLLAYTCSKPLPCSEHTDFQPQGLGNDERTRNMGGQAHATASVEEDGTATATATAPEADTSADESSTEDTQGETAAADEPAAEESSDKE